MTRPVERSLLLVAGFLAGLGAAVIWWPSRLENAATSTHTVISKGIRRSSTIPSRSNRWLWNTLPDSPPMIPPGQGAPSDMLNALEAAGKSSEELAPWIEEVLPLQEAAFVESGRDPFAAKTRTLLDYKQGGEGYLIGKLADLASSGNLSSEDGNSHYAMALVLDLAQKIYQSPRYDLETNARARYAEKNLLAGCSIVTMGLVSTSPQGATTSGGGVNYNESSNSQCTFKPDPQNPSIVWSACTCDDASNPCEVICAQVGSNDECYRGYIQGGVGHLNGCDWSASIPTCD